MQVLSSKMVRDASSADPPTLRGMIGASPAMREVFELTCRVADSSATVLLQGETGTGKELVARAVHELSPRRTGPFIRVNCGALSETLLESELFGHVKGAFTSAIENRTGRFEAAHGGSIFLDEINSLSYTLQVKLLRVLQEHEFERVGDTRTVSVDCRVIAATNRDLAELADEGQFREDLYYRLNVVPIYLPPLRNHSEDVPALVEHFLRKYCEENGRTVTSVSSEAIGFLQSYSWPGNVRELENYVERAVVLARGPSIGADLLPRHVRGEAPIRVGRTGKDDLETLCSELVGRELRESVTEGTDYARVMGKVERELILQVLRMCQGTQTKTASRLGINRNTLHKKIEEHGLQDDAR